MATIREQTAEVRKRMDMANLDHKRAMSNLRHELEMIQLECPHPMKRERWIMGREQVTECLECDKEF